MACLKAVDSKRQSNLVLLLRSQMMQEPSLLALTACELSRLIWIDHTLLLCSFIDASITCVCLVIFALSPARNYALPIGSGSN